MKQVNKLINKYNFIFILIALLEFLGHVLAKNLSSFEINLEYFR